MSESCTHNCETCSAKCDSAEKKNSFIEEQNKMSDIKNVIAVVSGKGGVGKSLITSLLAVEAQRKGFKTAVIDADITGPSMPQSFGIHQKAEGNDLGIFPAKTSTGIELMSLNLLIENETDPVIWRGPVIAGAVKQFWTDVVWGDLDYLFIDMPPGTGDVPLTVFQSIPVNGIEIVTSPQDLVSLIVKKAYNMAKLMNIPVIGMVENMSYVKCPDCGKEMHIFGDGAVSVAKELDLKLLSKIPLDKSIADLVDAGKFDDFDGEYMKDAVTVIETLF